MSGNVDTSGCYLCESVDFTLRKGAVRDSPEMKIYECESCGLVSLRQSDHISTDFYENSGMHGTAMPSIEEWLKETEWDDQRRYMMLKSAITNKEILDFGCGAGGFLKKAEQVAKKVTGIELESRVQEYWDGTFSIVPDIDSMRSKFDVITAFHVVEHLKDPRDMLRNLAGKLSPGGRLIVEVPSGEDALLTLFDCDAFQHFTYWSQHLFLFSAHTLAMLARQAGLNVVSINHYQRYPLSNHLHWLSNGKPGGHQRWSFLDTPELNEAYARALASIGKTDTLIAHFQQEE